MQKSGPVPKQSARGGVIIKGGDGSIQRRDSHGADDPAKKGSRWRSHGASNGAVRDPSVAARHSLALMIAVPVWSAGYSLPGGFSGLLPWFVGLPVAAGGPAWSGRCSLSGFGLSTCFGGSFFGCEAGSFAEGAATGTSGAFEWLPATAGGGVVPGDWVVASVGSSGGCVVVVVAGTSSGGVPGSAVPRVGRTPGPARTRTATPTAAMSPNAMSGPRDREAGARTRASTLARAFLRRRLSSFDLSQPTGLSMMPRSSMCC